MLELCRIQLPGDTVAVAGPNARGSKGSLAEVDSVLEEGFEEAAHVRPATAVAVGAVEAGLGLAPSGFGDADESVGGVELLEGDLDGGLVAGRGG